MAEKKYGNLLYALIEMQQLDTELLGRLSIEHINGQNVDPNVAFKNIITGQQNRLQNLKSIAYPCNKSKLFDLTQNPPTLKNAVDIKTIDSTLLHDILTGLDGFPVSKPTNPNNRVRCAGCNNRYRRKKICCNRCNICNQCNQQLQPLQQCHVFKLNLGLKKDKLLRNLVAHLTLQTLQNFLDGVEVFPDFPNVKTWKELCDEFVSAVTYLCDYLCDQTNFQSPNIVLLTSLEKAKKLRTMEDVMMKDLKTENDVALWSNLKEILNQQHQQQINEINKVDDLITKNHNEVIRRVENLQGDVAQVIVKLAEVHDENVITHSKLDILKDGQDNIRRWLEEGKLKELTSGAEQSTAEQRSENNSTRKMDVVIHMAYGCIFKTHVSPDYVLKRVMIKCINKNHESDCSDVFEKQDDVNKNDGDAVRYEIKDLGENVLLLKLENLEELKKYHVFLETHEELHSGEVEVCGEINERFVHKDLENELTTHHVGNINCDHNNYTHATTIKDSFTVLSPPLGQPNDPQNCHNGLQGYFIERSEEAIMKVSNGVSIEQMTIDNFIIFCQEYFERNFPNTKEVVQFPPLDLINDSTVKKISSLFVELLSEREELRAVLTNLDFKKYLRCTKTCNKLQTDLSFENRITVLDQTTESIINIRVIEQTNIDWKLYKEMEKSVLDMQYLVSTHRHDKCSCFAVTLIAFPNMSRSEITSQMSYFFTNTNASLLNVFYLSKEDLQDILYLRKWWNDAFEKELERISPCKDNFDTQSFHQICAQLLATIALAEVSPTLPTLKPDPQLQIQSLLLNKDQIKAIESSTNRKLIVGGYGTGKSVILDEITKRKFQECLHAKEKTLLISVVWESYSLLELQKKWLLDKLTDCEPNFSPNLITLCGNVHTLWQDINKNDEVTLFKFIWYYLGNSGFEVVHMIIDELPTNCVHIKELKSLNQLLKKYPKSSVTIAPQSVVIDRKTQTKEWEKNHDQNCLDKIDLDRFELKKVMRNTKQITALLKASQDKLNNTETVLSVYDPEMDDSKTEDIKTEDRKSAGILEALKRKLKVSFGSSRGMETKDGISDTQSFDQNSETQIQQFTSTFDQSDHPSTLPPTEFGKVSKFIEAEEVNKTTTSHIKTTYKFYEIENGNGVMHQKPTLIKLPLEFDLQSELSAKIFTLTLTELCHLKRKAQTLILCSSLQEVIFVSYCLYLIPNFEFVTYIPQLQGYFPTRDERCMLYSEFNDGKCILTDNTGIKGMEANRVIIFSAHDEYFEKYVITETLSRANVSAYIILHSPTVIDQRQTLGNMFDDLGCELLHVENVRLCEDRLNFDKQFFHEDNMFKVNSICSWQLSNKQTFLDYQQSFLHEHPIQQRAENYRNTFKEVTLLQKYAFVGEIKTHIGKVLKFDDVYYLLRSNVKKFRKLLSFNPNIANSLHGWNDRTLLIESCSRRDRDVTILLLEEFGDVIDLMERDVRGWTAYHWAAMGGDVDIMKMMLAIDLSGLNVKANDGWTPLHFASFNNHIHIVELLLHKGCDMNIQSDDGRTPDQLPRVSQEIRTMIEKHRNK